MAERPPGRLAIWILGTMTAAGFGLQVHILWKMLRDLIRMF